MKINKKENFNKSKNDIIAYIKDKNEQGVKDLLYYCLTYLAPQQTNNCITHLETILQTKEQQINNEIHNQINNDYTTKQIETHSPLTIPIVIDFKKSSEEQFYTLIQAVKALNAQDIINVLPVKT